MSDSWSSLIFPFSADLTDCFLTALLDFQSLQTFISSSKFVYSVFQYRQNSILSAVAQSQLGPALPQAMRLVWYLDGTHSPALAHEVNREVQDFRVMITPAQARLLRDHATIVRTLEEIYSRREKDPRFGTSRLSPAESLRFQQSMYRFWLLTAAYGSGALVDKTHEYRDGNRLQFKDSVVTKQRAFLLSLGKPELVGVDEVHGFLLDLAKWALVKHTTPQTRLRPGLGDRDDIYLVWGGPAVTLDAVGGKWPFFGPIDPQWYGTWRAMTRAFSSIEITSITGGNVMATPRQRFILDDYFLKTIGCSHCGGLPGSGSRNDSLWSFCNWEYMILAISPSRLASLLSFERTRPLGLLVSFTEAIESIPYSQFIEEIFDIRSARYKHWKKDDWLCTQCMIQLLSGSIHIWLDERMKHNCLFL